MNEDLIVPFALIYPDDSTIVRKHGREVCGNCRRCIYHRY